MPGPSSAHSKTTRLPSRRARSHTWPPARRVLHRVVREVGQGLAQTRPVASHLEIRGRVDGQGDALVFGRRPRRARPSRGAGTATSRASRAEGHGAGLGLRDVHERREGGGHAVALLDAGGEGRARRLGARSPRSALSAVARSRCRGVRRSWATLSSEPFIPAMRASMRSSISLASRPRSSRGSPSLRTGTRAETWPVRTMPPSTAREPAQGSQGLAGERARRRPRRAAPRRANARAARARKRAGCRRGPRSSCPPRRAVPSGRRTEATSKPVASHEPGTLAKTACPPVPVRRTTRPSLRPAIRSWDTAALSACKAAAAVVPDVLLEGRGHELAVALAQRRLQERVGEAQERQRPRPGRGGRTRGPGEGRRRAQGTRGAGRPRLRHAARTPCRAGSGASWSRTPGRSSRAGGARARPPRSCRDRTSSRRRGRGSWSSTPRGRPGA